MKTNLIKTAAAALIAALAAGAMLPGEVAAKPSGKPPISKPLPKWYFKKKVYLNCQVIQEGQQRKVRIGNWLGYTLKKHTRISWRAKGSRGSVAGVVDLYRPLPAGGYILRNVPSTITSCRASFMASINRY
ncbi:MAG: hypothetical protein O7I42_15510 [Alphaproteobacteria bacterium]|nr:hypothetical protein [Alphaproteobacteria bacterium]